jgi:hypothetical protein
MSTCSAYLFGQSREMRLALQLQEYNHTSSDCLRCVLRVEMCFSRINMHVLPLRIAFFMETYFSRNNQKIQNAKSSTCVRQFEHRDIWNRRAKEKCTRRTRRTRRDDHHCVCFVHLGEIFPIMIGFFATTANVIVDTSEIVHARVCCQVFFFSFASERSCCSSPSLSSVFVCVGWCISPSSGGLLRYLQLFWRHLQRQTAKILRPNARPISSDMLVITSLQEVLAKICSLASQKVRFDQGSVFGGTQLWE